MSSSDNQLDAKILRFFRFLEKSVDRYELPRDMLERFGIDFTKYTTEKNKKERLDWVGTVLPLTVQSSPSLAQSILLVRSFYEHMEASDRAQVLDESIVPMLRQFAAGITAVADVLEENKTDVCDDMRTMGGYLTMFTEGYLKKAVDTAEQQ